MKQAKLDEIIINTIYGFWITLTGFTLFIGKKLVDWIFDASIQKFERTVGKVVEEKLNPIDKRVTKIKHQLDGYDKVKAATLDQIFKELDKINNGKK